MWPKRALLLVVLAACGGSAGTDLTGAPPASPDASSTAPTPTGTNNVPPPALDAGRDAATLEGGANIDPDGGPGNLPDGGTCNTIDQRGSSVASTCQSFAPLLTGGALVSGTYRLTGVTALGSINFCRNQFVSTSFRETLELIKGGDAFTAEIVADIGAAPRGRSTLELSPTPGDASPLKARELCPTTRDSASTVEYESSTEGGKTRLALVLPYGRALAVYRFEKE